MKKCLWVCMVVAVLLSGIGCGNGAGDFGRSFSAEDVDVVLTTEIAAVEESVAQTEQLTIEELATSSSSLLTETEKQTEKEKTQAKPTVTTAAKSTVPSVVTDAPPQTTAAPETQAPTTAPLITSAPTTQAPATVSPTTAPPTLAPPIQAAFDPEIYVQYAISYGKSIGLTYHSEVHESWDNPIDAGAGVLDEYLKSSIRSRLDRYKNVEGFEYFNVWFENGRNSEYRIVIAYA